MTPGHLTTLWTVLGPVIVFIALDHWITLQGGKPFFGTDLLHGNEAGVAIFGVILTACLLIILALILRQYALASKSTGWAGRLPVVGLTGLDTSSKAGRFYQGFFLVVFLLVPSGALVHFLRVLRDQPVKCDSGGTPDPYDFTAFADLGPRDPCRIGGDTGVTWFPVLEPALLVGVSIFAWLLVARALLALRR